MGTKDKFSNGTRIDGRAIASEILNNLKSQVEKLKKNGINPTLAIILIGNNESSKSYIKQKELKASEIGAEINLFHFQSTSETELLTLINKLNNDNLIHGIIVQRPLPSEFDRILISKSISPEKDVDGFNSESKFDAPVAEAIIEILKNIDQANLTNKKIVVIGRGETAGKPVIKLLSKLRANPTIIDHTTQNPEELIRAADIIISAVGHENIIKPDNLNSSQILIGVGLFSKDGKLKGDYEELEIADHVKFYTPTIGGVGPVNVACLMRNLLLAAESKA